MTLQVRASVWDLGFVYPQQILMIHSILYLLAKIGQTTSFLNLEVG